MVSAAHDIMGAVVEEISVSAVPEDAAVVSSGKLAMERGKDQLDEGGMPGGGEAQPGLRVGVCRKLRGRGVPSALRPVLRSQGNARSNTGRPASKIRALWVRRVAGRKRPDRVTEGPAL